VDHILPYLFFLACPISMGLMMWMMMRKDHNSASTPQSDPRVAELESQVGELRMALHQRQAVETASVTPITNADRE
jgi:hypothetical protein